MSTITNLQPNDDGADSLGIINTNFANLNADKVEKNTKQFVYKSADEIVNNNTTFQDDDHLTFAVGANETWVFTLFMSFISAATPDIKYKMTAPSGSRLRTHSSWYSDVFYDGSAFYEFIIHSGNPSDERGDVLTGICVNGSTAGSVTFQWAQNVAEASDTTVKQGSYIIAERLA